MPLPSTSNIEIPILQELVAVGGADDVRYLYERLISYFPSLSDGELLEIKKNSHRQWRGAVQKAGKILDDNQYIRRERGFWKITDLGVKRVEAETEGFLFAQSEKTVLNHENIQKMLVQIGKTLGFYAVAEFEYYDVIWRAKPESQRISHVFEVQSKGNIDSAFAKLKRAFDAQRSQPFLIISSERDTKRAAQSVSREFQELQQALTIISFVELEKVYGNLNSIKDLLGKFLKV